MVVTIDKTGEVAVFPVKRCLEFVEYHLDVP